MFKTAFFALLAATCCPAQYALQSNFSGAAFFDNFDFYDSWDPTLGFVHYVDRTTAQAFGLINASESGPATFGVEHTQILDPEANLGRASLRLISHQTWTHGLFILDLAHMPASQCGTWPAFWTVGGPSEWPQNGEIDIIEYTNTKTNNSMALHTRENCTIAGSGQTGKLLTNDCGKDLGVAGCYVAPNKSDSAGSSFNSIGGGVYAMEWTSVAIRIWFFPRLAIPANVRSPNPDPALWGLPDANFESSDCDIDSYFFNHSILFDTEFCGTWAGPTFVEDACPALNPSNQWSSCNEYVAANPEAYVNSYWAVNYLQVFSTMPGTPPPPSSPLVSVLPAASTTSVTASGAEGRSTTASGTLAPPSTSSVTTATSSTTSSTSPATMTSPSAIPPPASTSSTFSTSSSTPFSSSSTTTSSTSPPTTALPSTSAIDGPIIIETTTEVVVWVTTTVMQVDILVNEGSATQTLELGSDPSPGVTWIG